MGKSDQPARHDRKGQPADFDLDDPKLPDWVASGALRSGGYPYAKEMPRKEYERELTDLQIELAKLQVHVQREGERVVVLFEGRDTAGKGGCIGRFMQHLNPRHARTIALSKPTNTEQGQWYFQRYIAHLPTRGDIVLFDRSWYNRAGIERVMGFCTPEQSAQFLREAPEFEGMLIREGIRLFKIYLSIGREMQLKRIHKRRHDPLKQWKLTDMDLAAISRWNAYSEAQEEMFRFTHTPQSKWTVIRANDQRRARLESIRLVLSAFEYTDKKSKVVGTSDPKLVGEGKGFFDSH